MKNKFFAVFLALTILLVSCEPMEPTDSIDVERLKEQNQLLSQQLLESQEEIQKLQNEVNVLSTQTAQLQPVPIPEGTLEELAAEILPVMQAKDFVALARFVHPEKGVRFSPQGYIKTDTDLVFTREQVANFALYSNNFTWGAHFAKDELLEMSVNDYWDKYVVPLLPDQEWVMLDEDEETPSEAIDNFYEVYPQGRYIDFLKPGTEEFSNLDWQSLRLAFEQAADGAYYLVGIIHDNWVP